MILDTHCHYNLEPLFGEHKKHWQTAVDHEVIGAICVGTNLQTSNIALELASKYSNMFVSLGIHPNEYTEKMKTILIGDTFSETEIIDTVFADIQALEKILLESLQQKKHKVVAIGEIGLDYYRLKTKGLKRQLVEAMQKKTFTNQLELAFRHKLPVILHVRDLAERTQKNAYYDTLEIIENLINAHKKDGLETPPFILHCASGPKDYIEKCIKLGAYFGFAGNITYTNAPEIRTILEMTPKDKILLETDAPYLAPGDKKNQICEPFYITQTASFLRDTYSIDLDIILANTVKVFPQFQKVL